MRVAICDDDQKDISRLTKLLEQYDAEKHIGFTVGEYESGVKLLNSLKGGAEADIVFLDINMDDLDGLTVAKHIREKLEDVPIVLVTAYMNYALD
ncbi:MAG: response regulator, partial [Lachnospiraceae bacterium]|nr:response regulator [Lachnospiraceae bacterium]